MSALQFLLYFFGGLALLASVSIVFIKNVFHGALLLLVCLLALAALYILLNAEFLAMTQILVYAGGVLTIILFGIMLTSKQEGGPMVVKTSRWFSGLLVGAPLFAMMAWLFSKYSQELPLRYASSEVKIKQLGVALMSDYLLPFEMAGLLLLMALVGAVVTASVLKKHEP